MTAPEQFPDSVRIVLSDEANPDRVLVVAEADDPDNYKLPGGKFKPGESPEEAAARELLEEVGVSPELVALRGIGVLVNQHSSASKRYIFSGQVPSEAVKPTAEIAQSAWVTTDTIPEGQNRDHIMAAIDFSRTEPRD